MPCFTLEGSTSNSVLVFYLSFVFDPSGHTPFGCEMRKQIPTLVDFRVTSNQCHDLAPSKINEIKCSTLKFLFESLDRPLQLFFPSTKPVSGITDVRVSSIHYAKNLYSDPKIHTFKRPWPRTLTSRW